MTTFNSLWQRQLSLDLGPNQDIVFQRIFSILKPADCQTVLLTLPG